MGHHAGVAVVVAEEAVGREVADNLLHIHRLRRPPLRQGLQGRDYPLPVRLGDVGLGVVKDIGVVLRAVPAVPQAQIAVPAAVGEAAGSLRPVPRTHSGRRRLPRPLRRPVPRGTARDAVLRGPDAGSASARRSSAGHPDLPVRTHTPLLRAGLVQRTPVPAKVPPEKCLLHALHRQVQPPVLPVDGEEGEAAQRRGHAGVGHHGIAEVVLEAGVVLNNIVQTQLIQPIETLVSVVVVKLNFEAVAAAAHTLHGGEGGVPLGPKAHISARLPVNHHRAGDILLIGTARQEVRPVVHDDIDGVNPVRIKEPVGVGRLGGGSGAVRRLCVHQHQHGCEQHQGRCRHTDFVNVLTGAHGVTPYSRRCS